MSIVQTGEQMRVLIPVFIRGQANVLIHFQLPIRSHMTNQDLVLDLPDAQMWAGYLQLRQIEFPV